MSPKDVGGMANSVDRDHLDAVWSASSLFAQTYLSENLGSLWYYLNLKNNWNKGIQHESKYCYSFLNLHMDMYIFY